MENNKGFTLVEIISVVVILGIIMLVAVPAVSNYIVDSRKSSYVLNVSAYLETANGEYLDRYYGSYLLDDEIMIVPMEIIDLEEENGGKTPFGDYIYEKSYIIIVPERNTFKAYANSMDTAGYGVEMMPLNAVTKDFLKKYDDTNAIKDWTLYDGSLEVFSVNGRNYSFCESRDSENAKAGVESKIIVMCENK
jgi:prepilin-type N-terminal cleavage/methylation domain-containing protein